MFEANADAMSYFENNYAEKNAKIMDESKLYLYSAEMFRPIYEKVAKKEFVPQHKGWVVTHPLRGNNAMGAKILNIYLFEFNKELTEITDIKSID